MVKNERSEGLIAKYDVQRRNDADRKHDDCRYFVLDPKHDPIARLALEHYILEARARGYFALSNDLDLWINDLIQEDKEEER